MIMSRDIWLRYGSKVTHSFLGGFDTGRDLRFGG